MTDAVALAIIVAIPGTIAAVGTAITAILVAKQGGNIEKLERNTNSMKDALVKVTAESEFAKGKIEGAAGKNPV
jgi:hypothetical protein